MKFHLLASAIVAIAGAVLRVDAGEWLWLLSAIAAVWVTELLNTGVERAVDLASPDDHELAKIAKDAAAGAVLVASLYAAAVGVIVLGPPLWRAFFGS
ncbi:diacylglycerol kinase family protein [Cohnella sp. CBP 2801]|uniref:Diacylglycerol kinase family protein n=2 Tax=Cohnella zeiphila TaxID=2761120 RepID=A0A7X0SJ91_9BACL|nr:diacylglycerol kinase family protein [Cohnella zeiphila]